MVAPALFTNHTDEWTTPLRLMRWAKTRWEFTLDVCASANNAQVSNYFDVERNGLFENWEGVCWMNPPYSQVDLWINKAWREMQTHGAVVVALLPARTDTSWWHRYVMSADRVWFIKGRLHFGGSTNPAPFPNCVVLFQKWNGQYLTPTFESLLLPK